MNIEEIQKLLYSSSKEKIISSIANMQDEDSLYTFISNYNWDNGFEIPTAILSNPNCTLNVALTVFSLADGFTYLTSKEICDDIPEWKTFIEELYCNIINNNYKAGAINYSPNLTKVEKYKLSKVLNEQDQIFLNEIDGKQIDVII